MFSTIDHISRYWVLLILITPATLLADGSNPPGWVGYSGQSNDGNFFDVGFDQFTGLFSLYRTVGEPCDPNQCLPHQCYTITTTINSFQSISPNSDYSVGHCGETSIGGCGCVETKTIWENGPLDPQAPQYLQDILAYYQVSSPGGCLPGDGLGGGRGGSDGGSSGGLTSIGAGESQAPPTAVPPTVGGEADPEEPHGEPLGNNNYVFSVTEGPCPQGEVMSQCLINGVPTTGCLAIDKVCELLKKSGQDPAPFAGLHCM